MNPFLLISSQPESNVATETFNSDSEPEVVTSTVHPSSFFLPNLKIDQDTDAKYVNNNRMLIPPFSFHWRRNSSYPAPMISHIQLLQRRVFEMSQFEYVQQQNQFNSATRFVETTSKSIPTTPFTGNKRLTDDARADGQNKKQRSSSGTPANDEESENPSNKSRILREDKMKINFESLGNRGDYPQTFGTLGALVPDGLCGTYKMYNQLWRFEIIHGKPVFDSVGKLKCVCITWDVTNLTTGTLTSRIETIEEAVIRNSQGFTICNQVFREALEARTKHLESLLANETDHRRLTRLLKDIKVLRPKRFSEGLRVFGLHHRIVQEQMREKEETR